MKRLYKREIRWKTSEKNLGAAVASFHCSAMSVVMMRCQKSYYKEQWMVLASLAMSLDYRSYYNAGEDLANHGRLAISRNGHLVDVVIDAHRG